jgi:uncharacterized protein (DUF2236 family)
MTTAAKTPTKWPPPGRLAEAGVEGLFGPDTVTWRVQRETLLGAVGGGRALILQVAHPLVAAGVAQSSDFRADPYGRLLRTLEATTAIVFGDPEEAETAARRVWSVHAKVKGTSVEDTDPHPAGTPFSARDPELALWVHATLFDTSLVVYERFVGRLPQDERERFYEEQKLFAEMFAVPYELIPATYAEFQDYFARVVERDLAVTETLLDVVDATLLRPPMPWPVRPLRPGVARAFKLITAGLLPPRVRDLLGLPWGPGRERLLGAAQVLVRTGLPLAPGIVREFPRARAADRRLAAAS